MQANAQTSHVFFRRVILPLAGLLLALLLSAVGGIFWIAGYQTEVAIAQQVRLARGALRIYGEKLALSAGDYGYWDEAVAAIVDEPNPEWVRENIGAGAEKSLGVAMAFVLDADGGAIYSRVGGVDGKEDPARFFPKGFKEAYAAWRQLPADRSYSGVVPYGRSAALIAIASIRPWDDAARPTTGYALLFVQLLDETMLMSLTRDYELDDLRIVQSDQDVSDPRATLSINDGLGRMVSRLAWMPNRPGDGLLAIALPFIAVFLLVLTTLGAFVVRHAIQNARLINDRERRAFRDPLTGLANRALFFVEADKALRDAGNGRGVAVMYIDLDDFKPVNDTMGHAAGDVLLQQVARRLLGCVSGGDLVARLGGDEFAVLLRGDRSATDLEAGAEAILREVARPLPLPGGATRVTCSIGIASSDDPEEAALDLLNRADRALYRAKAVGRNCVIFDREDEGERTLGYVAS